MTIQLGLLDAQPQPLRRRHHVQATSVQAYREMNHNGRMALVVRMLSEEPYFLPPLPTSAELASEAYARQVGDRWEAGKVSTPLEIVLYVRAGLSDAKRHGLVENVGKRRCRCSGKTALTWQVKCR